MDLLDLLRSNNRIEMGSVFDLVQIFLFLLKININPVIGIEILAVLKGLHNELVCEDEV